MNLNTTKPLLFLTIGSFAGAGAAFFTQVLAARSIAAEDFGIFSSALSLVALATPLAGFGVGMLLLRNFGEEGWHAIRWLPPAIRFTAISTAATCLSLWAWAYFGPHGDVSTRILLTLSLMVVGQAAIEIASAVYQVEEKYASLALFQLSPHLIRLSGIAAFSLLPFGELSALTIATLYSFPVVILLFHASKKIHAARVGGIDLKGHGKKNSIAKADHSCSSIEVCRGAWPFGLSTLFHLIYFQSGIVLSNYFISPEAAAWYSVSILMLMAVYIFPGVVYQKYFLPKIHRWANKDTGKIKDLYGRGNLIMFVFGLLVALILYILSPFIIPLLFGEEYLASVEIFSILCLAVPVRFLSSNIGAILVTKETIKTKVAYMGIVAIIFVATSLTLLPHFDIGALLGATLISEIILLLLYHHMARKFINRL